MIPRTDDRWIELFLDAKTAEQGLAHNSQLAYLRDLAGFKAFLVPARTTFHAVTQSDIEAYQQIGDALSAAGKFDHLFSEQPQAPASKPRNTDKKKADDSKRRNKRRAASPAKPTAPSAPKDDFNPLGMSDEEFMSQSDSKFL